MRALNRALLETRLESIFFFASMFFALCAALALPTLFHRGFFYSNVNLGDVEIAGMFTSAVVNQITVIILLIFCSCLMFIPLLHITDKIVIPVTRHLGEYWLITNNLLYRIRAVVFSSFVYASC